MPLSLNFEVIESLEEIEEDAEYIAVLYQDTPLVDYAFLMELTQKGEGFAIGDGYIKKPDMAASSKSVDDIRAKTNKDFGRRSCHNKRDKKKSA